MSQQRRSSEFDRRIWISHDLIRFKAAVRKRLNSPLGIELRRRRMTEPETVIAQIKHNRHFRRFLLRGSQKVKIKYGLVSIADNLINLANDPRRSATVNLSSRQPVHPHQQIIHHNTPFAKETV